MCEIAIVVARNHERKQDLPIFHCKLSDISIWIQWRIQGGEGDRLLPCRPTFCPPKLERYINTYDLIIVYLSLFFCSSSTIIFKVTFFNARQPVSTQEDSLSALLGNNLAVDPLRSLFIYSVPSRVKRTVDALFTVPVMSFFPTLCQCLTAS